MNIQRKKLAGFKYVKVGSATLITDKVKAGTVTKLTVDVLKSWLRDVKITVFRLQILDMNNIFFSFNLGDELFICSLLLFMVINKKCNYTLSDSLLAFSSLS